MCNFKSYQMRPLFSFLMPLNHLYGPHTIIGNLNRTEIWLTAFACCNWLLLMLFNPVFAVVQLPLYIFTISQCSSIGIHSNQPTKINFYHCQISSWSKPRITLVEIQQNILTWPLHAVKIWEMFKENAEFWSKVKKKMSWLLLCSELIGRFCLHYQGIWQTK